MELTPLRWSVLVAATCATAFVTFLPLSKRAVETWVPSQPAPLAAAMANVAEAAAESYAAVREYRTARGIERWSVAYGVHRDTTAVRLDTSVTRRIASGVRDAAYDGWSTLGHRASAAHAEVFVYVDSAEIPHAATAATGSVAAVRRPLEPHTRVDVAFALPETDDGTRCVALVRLRGTTPEHIAALRNAPLGGVCAFFATFGAPGAGVRPWLTANTYAFARRSDWDVPRAPVTDVGAVYSLSANAARCLTGALDQCRAALAADSARVHPSPSETDGLPTWYAAGSVATRSGGGSELRLGREEGRLLADVVRDLGPERFARFWVSDAPPATAFAAAAGVPLEMWTQRWLARTYGRTHGSPMPRLADLAWLAVASPALLAIAARRRERVLAERLRDRR